MLKFYKVMASLSLLYTTSSKNWALKRDQLRTTEKATYPYTGTPLAAQALFL
jgi:hypothetical protein